MHTSMLERNDLSYWDDRVGRTYIKTWKWRFGTTRSTRSGM